jgi:ketosteroid isomerase-like protein
MKIALVSLFCALNTFGQTAQQQINEQVWKPFIQAFNSRNTQAFMQVHSRDVVRSPRDSKAIWNWDEYFRQQEKGDKRESASSRQIELRFTERIATNDLAVEVGIYKGSYIESGGNDRSYYGRFHVVLRKEDGVWKILIDTDSSEGNTVGEDDFRTAQPMD